MDANFIALIAALIRGVATITRDPDLGVRDKAITQILDLAALALERGTEGAEALRELTAQVEAMVAEKRQPTPREWENLRARSDAAHAALQSVPEEDPESEEEKE